MPGIFKPSKELSLTEIEQVYSIHKHVYFNRGIGHSYECWKSNLFKPYHDTCTKEVQLFSDKRSPDVIAGYTITAGPLVIDGESWYKIIEAAISIGNHNNNIDGYISLISERISRNCKQSASTIAEIDIGHTSIINLSIKAGLSKCYDGLLMRNVLRTFLRSCPFELDKNSRGIYSHRQTMIKSDYIGQILIAGH